MVDQGPLVYGKYQLLELLARGGMAEVYKAKSYGVEGFEKILVIKRILSEHSSNPRFVAMFIHEAKLSVTLSHANIVQVFDLGRNDDSYFIAMEYVAGSDLSTVLKRGWRYGRPLPRELAIYATAEVAKGLDYAHRRRDLAQRPLNIVHRDVSPQNILISVEGEVKLTDFGIAKARMKMALTTEAGVLKGKYAYMAPEQARGEPLTPKSDIFALGTVLYEAIAGKNPFHSESTYETLKRVRVGWARPLAEAVPGVSVELSDVVARAMAPLAEDRFADAGEFQKALVELLFASGRPIGNADLAAHMASLDAIAAHARLRRSEERGLRASFEVRDETGRTPLARPLRTVSGRPSGAGGRETRTSERPSTGSPGVARPQAERRDVAILAIRTDVGGVSEEPVDRHVARFGGRRVRARGRAGAARSLTFLFGLVSPDGHEVEAAARCADALRSGLGLVAPMAIHAGRVLVRLEGDLLEDDRLERLQGEVAAVLAPTGLRETVVTPSTAVQVRAAFATSPLATRSDVVHLGASRPPEDRLGRFIGRRDVLRQVGKILAEASAGAIRFISLEGEAGVGKSRLLQETTRRLSSGNHDVGVYFARFRPQERDVPLSACHAVIRTVVGIEDDDADELIVRKVARLRQLGLTPADISAVETVLGLASRGGPLPTGERSLRGALARIAVKLAEDRLTVFAFDGLDYADDASASLLHRMLRDAGARRIAVIGTHREGGGEVFRDLPFHHTVALKPFDDQEVARCTAALVGADEVPMELLRQITQKSGGNPLLIEEYVRALTDEGAVRFAGQGKVLYDPGVVTERVPKTLRGVVASRLGKLGVAERRALQVAAIIGPSFPLSLLAHACGEQPATVEVSLSVLEQRDIIRRTGADDYQVVHELSFEVIREGFTDEARRELHLAVAEAMEQVYAHRLDEVAERVAYHFREAGARGEAAGYLERAATRLEAEHAFEGAIDQIAASIALVAPTADYGKLLDLYLRAGQVACRARVIDKGTTLLEDGVELAELAGRSDYLARLCLMRGQLSSEGTSFVEARAFLDRARRVTRTLDDEELLREVTIATAEVNARSGDYLQAIGLLREALELAKRAGDVPAQLRCLLPIALAHANAGATPRALSALEEARALVADDAPAITWELHQTEHTVHFHNNDLDRAIAAARAALEVSREHGLLDETATTSRSLGECYLRRGQFREAYPHLRHAYDLAVERKLGRIQFSVLCLLGVLDAVKFGSDEGRARIAEACEYASQRGHLADVVQAKFLLALVDQDRARYADAVAGFRDVMRLASEYGQVTYARTAEKAVALAESGEPIRYPI